MKSAGGDLRIIGVLRYVDFVPAFGLPVACNEDGQSLWIQVRQEHSQIISGFESLEKTAIDALDLADGPPVAVGGRYIHAFIGRNDQLYLDTIESLASFLGVTLNRVSTPLVTKLAICEQLGDITGERTFREKLTRDLAQSLGLASARAYKNSAIRARFWEILGRASVSAEAYERVQTRRSRLLASIDDAGEITLDASAIDLNDVRLPISEIASQLASEFQDASSDRPRLPRVDLSSARNLLNPTALAVISAVELSPRQEERVALLMRSVMVYPTVGAEAIHQYRDQAAFANKALEYLRQRLKMEQASESERGLILARAVPRLYTDSYPLQRGKLLYYLSVHLRDFPEIRDAILTALDRSTARDVEMYREDIERVLGRHSVSRN
jgi:hypothetical protein